MAFDLSHFDPIAGKFGLDPAAFRAALQHMWSGGGQSSGLGGGGNALGTPGGFQPNFPMMNGQPWWMHQQGAGGTGGSTPGQPWWPQHSPGMPAPAPQGTGGTPNLLQRATGFLGGGLSGGSSGGGPLQTLSGYVGGGTGGGGGGGGGGQGSSTSQNIFTQSGY